MSNNDTNNRIVLRTVDDNKELHLVSKGPRTATIVIPTHTTEFNFIDSVDIENIIASRLVSFSLLPKPVITSPLNQATDYTGGVTIDQNYSLPSTNTGYEVTTLFEISKTLTFTDFVVRKAKKERNIASLSVDELRNTGITKYDHEGNINIYYVRARIFYKDYVSEYSDPIAFSYTNDSFQTPTLSTCDIEEVNGRYTGNIKFIITPPMTQFGSPGTPNIIEIHVKESSQGDFTVIERDYTEPAFSLRMIPFIMYPGHSYHIKLRYKNTLNGLCSPFTTLITKTIATPRLHTVNLDIVQSVSAISSFPTIGVENIKSDYDYLENIFNPMDDVILPDNLKNSHVTNLTGGYLKYVFSLFRNGLSEYSRTFTKKLEDISKDYYKGEMFTVDDFNFNLNTEYTLKLNIDLFKSNNSSGSEISPMLDTTTFTTSNFKNNIPNDGLSRPITTYNSLNFYGEITESKLMPASIRYTGEFDSGRRYRQGDEVIYNNELYVYTGAERTIQTITDPDMLKITDSNFNNIYKSGLPRYSWLAKEIGLPVGVTVEIDKEGNIINRDICSPVVNDTEGWIKAQNKSNQIIYIAKKPIVTNIPYKELERRFLTGHSSRTIRLGNKYYSVRLIEYSPNSSISPSYSLSTKNNVENETGLFSELFLNLNTYTLQDLGILNEETMFYGAEMVIMNKDSGRIETDIRQIKSSELDLNELVAYRPVLEYLQEGYLPFRKPKDLPGTNILTYDKWSDTGYYGSLTSNSLVTGNEIKSMLGLLNLNVENNNILFHKFYYHGLTIYIPSKPIGNGVTFKELAKADAIYGTDDRNIKFNIISSDYVISLLSGSRDYSGGESKGLLYELLGRVSTTLNEKIKPVCNLSKWTTTEEFDHSVLDGVYLKDIASENVRYTMNNGDMSQIPSDGDGSYLPIIIAETLDLSQDLKYASETYKTPTITMQDVTVRKSVITKESITKERAELKTKLVTKIKWVTRIKKIPNGKITFTKTSKNKDDTFGVILYYAAKTDNAYLANKLYDKTMLNVAKYKGTLGIQYSDKFTSIDNFMLRSVMSLNKNKLVATPLHINKTFSNSTQLKNYIRELAHGEYSLCSLKNYVPDIPNTSEDRSKPLGMMFGNISSSIMYYILPSTYDLYPPTANVNGKMNISPVINYLDGKYKNSWTSMLDRNDVTVSVPMLNSFLPYDAYTTTGKELIDAYIKYIAVDLGLDLSGSNFDVSIDNVKKNYVFGVIGVELTTLYYLDGNGIVYGDMYSPLLKQFTNEYRLPLYFGTSGTAFSKGNDFTDIMNPIEGYDEIELDPEPVEYQVEEQYTEYVPYVTEEYVEKFVEEVVRVPILTYV